MLEARTGKDGPEWQYAFAPHDDLRRSRRSWKGREVWSLPDRQAVGPRPNRSSAGPTGPGSERHDDHRR